MTAFLNSLRSVPLLLTLCGTAVLAEDAITPTPVELGREVTYDQDVAPVLKANCLACHNTTKSEGALNLETVAGMLKGGDSGAAIEPGDPDASYLYLVASRESEPVMPPLPNNMNAHKLTGAEVWKLKRWIELGAPEGEAAGHKSIIWTGMPSHLQPTYSMALFPREDRIALGRGNRLQVISLTDPQQLVELVDPELSVAHRDFVNAVAIHPQGRVIASAGYRNVKIWQQEPYQLVDQGSLNEAVSASGVSASGNAIVAIGPSGRIVYRSDAGFKSIDSGLAEAVAIAIDDAAGLIAVAHAAGITVIPAATPDQPVQITPPKPCVEIAFAASRLLTAHADGTLQLWEKPADQPQWTASGAEFKKNDSPIVALQVTGPSAALALSDDGNATLWDLEKRAANRGWAAGGDAVAVSVDSTGKSFATVHESGSVRVWDDQGKQVREFKQKIGRVVDHKSLERQVAVAKSLSTNATTLQKAATDDLKTRQTSVETTKKTLETTAMDLAKANTAHEKTVTELADADANLAKTPDADDLKKKQEAATKARDEALAKLNTAKEEHRRAETTLKLEQDALTRAEALLKERDANVKQTAERLTQLTADLAAAKKSMDEELAKSIAACFLDPQRLAVTTGQGEVAIWNLATGAPIGSASLKEWQPVVDVLDLPGGLLCGIQEQGQLTVVTLDAPWTLQARLGENQEPNPFIDRVTALAFSPDGTLLATGGGDPSRDGELQLWNWSAGQIAKTLEGAHSDVVLTVAFSEDGTHLASGSADKFVKVFRVPDGNQIASFEGHTEHVLDVDWAADGLTLSSASADQSVKVWNRLDGSQIRTITSFGKQVTGVKYIGVSDNLATSSGDKVVRMVTASNGRNYRSMSGSEQFLNAVAVTDDEGLVIAAGHDGVVRIWNGKDGKLLQTLPPAKAAE
ncbi:c-type cytochrome domain-containing protein [Rubinisphaera margarita]|uniref:c-type cytochrome domain-containing protein n=1 Tax=Rubinisphaera margarita TaxID=2909586 RepID=UPI001EE85583|nr:c-type cytochrome domain-containing protein [Rubinisphaera margarita]MCG6157989.1 hypothetical protein [Rubinisphaera margarita]